MEISNSDKFVSVEVRRRTVQLHRLFKVCEDKAVVAGSYARLALAEDAPVDAPDDMDIFVLAEKDFVNIVTRLDLITDPDEGLKVTETPVCTTGRSGLMNMKVQVIHPVFQDVKTLDDILGSFDFSVARAMVYQQDGKLCGRVSALFEEDCKNKKLRIEHIHCPISSVYRIAKYRAKGFSINLVEVLKLFFDWETRPASYRRDLMELSKQGESGELTTDEIDHLERLLRID